MAFSKIRMQNTGSCTMSLKFSSSRTELLLMKVRKDEIIEDNNFIVLLRLWCVKCRYFEI